MDTIAKRNIRAASSHRSTLILLAAASLAWLGGGNALQAQSVTAILVGTISDQSGAAVPNATLSLTRLGTNLKRTVVSNEKGDFTIPNLEPGSYQLIGEHEGSNEPSWKESNS